MNETPKVYSAINAVQLAMSKEGIAKGRKNQQQGYAFRGIDDVYGALAPHLAANGLCIIPRVVHHEIIERQTKAGGALFYTTLKVEFDFVAMADGSKHTACTIGEAMDSGDKSSNKAMSAAYKYACFLTFAIPTEGENDADSVTHPTLEPAKKGLETPAKAIPAPVQVPREPLDPAGAGWRTVTVPKFIKKYAGQTLGDMAEQDLLWWANSYEPKPYQGTIQQKDLDFKAALQAAKAELDPVEDVPTNVDQDVPF